MFQPRRRSPPLRSPLCLAGWHDCGVSYRRRYRASPASTDPISGRSLCLIAAVSQCSAPVVRHGARGGRCGSPLVICQHFPLRARREMGADPCPQTEAGPTAPPWRQVCHQPPKIPLPRCRPPNGLGRGPTCSARRNNPARCSKLFSVVYSLSFTYFTKSLRSIFAVGKVCIFLLSHG